MTDRSKLLALAEAVEKLTGADRAIDGMIAKAIGAHPCWATVQKDRQPELFTDGQVGLRAREWLAPKYTASLDAAMMLVPENECWRVGHDADDPSGFAAQCSYTPEPGHMGFVIGRGATAALALTAAALSARGHAQAEALA